jgi:hypothetical protein
MFQTEYLKSMLIVNQNYKIKLIRCSLATACNCRADRVIASSVSPRQALVLPTRRILPVPSMQTSMRASSQNSEVSSTWKQGQSSHPRKKKRQRRTNKRVIVILYTLRTIYAHTIMYITCSYKATAHLYTRDCGGTSVQWFCKHVIYSVKLSEMLGSKRLIFRMP